MKRSVTVFIFITIILSLFSQAFAAEIQKRKCNCFMKELDGFTKSEFDSMFEKDLTAKLETRKIDSTAHESIQAAGQKIFEAHKDKIEGLISKFNEILDVPIKIKYSEDELKKVLTSAPVIDFKYYRNLSRALTFVAYYLICSGRDEDAIKLLILDYRFGQILAAGDGEPPSIMTHMIGIAIKNMAIRNIMVDFLTEAALTSKISPEKFGDYAKIFAKLDSDEVDFKVVIDTESHFIQNLAEKELWENPEDGAMKDAVAKIGKARLDEAKKTVRDKFAKVYERTFSAYSKYSGDFMMFQKEIESIFKKIQEDSKTGSAVLAGDPFDAIANIVLNIAYPTFGRAYERHLASKFYVRGAYLTARFLAAGKVKTPPADAAAFEKACGEALPKDMYTGKQLIFKKIENEIVIYSVGPDGADNGGDSGIDNNKSDIVLMRLPFEETQK